MGPIRRRLAMLSTALVTAAPASGPALVHLGREAGEARTGAIAAGAGAAIVGVLARAGSHADDFVRAGARAASHADDGVRAGAASTHFEHGVRAGAVGTHVDDARLSPPLRPAPATKPHGPSLTDAPLDAPLDALRDEDEGD